MTRGLAASAIPSAIPGATAENALGVSAFLGAAKRIIEGAFEPIWQRGEVTEFKPHRNGHWYFTLKDGNASLRCKVWKSAICLLYTSPSPRD